jgi:phosphoribosyl-ATP pyrophosphohydrolase
MTKEEVVEMAIQVGIKRRTDEFYSEFCDGVYFDDFVTFAKLIAEREREACAKLCEEYFERVIASRIRARIQE